MSLDYSANLPQQRYKAEQVRENEGLIAQKKHISLFELMLKAGLAAFQFIDNQFRSSKMTVLTGYGNNGGDGYIIARAALQDGWQVRLIQLGDPAKLKGDAAKARDLFLQAGGLIGSVAQIDTQPLETDTLIVDAMLGTGISGVVRGEFELMINWVNQNQHRKVVSIDIPSGIDADTGQVMGVAVKADATVTFVAVKQGLSTGMGPDHVGELVLADLSIGEDFIKAIPAASLCIDSNDLKPILPPRQLSTHKGQCGHVLLIGSNVGMSGAIRLSAQACLRAGAGLVSVLTHLENEAIVASYCPELMVIGVADGQDISHWFNKADVVAIGPGLGQDDWGRDILAQALSLLKHTPKPCVIDADGLNLIAEHKFSGHIALALKHGVITPHPLEAARLLRQTTSEVQQDRFAAAYELSKRFDTVSLLKGVGTIICVNNDDKPFFINQSGNPGMATAGMGDVLSGIIAALLAQGLNNGDAAVFGAYIHGAAADLAAKTGERGMMASDLMPFIRQLVNCNE